MSLSMPLSDPDLKHRAGLSAIAGLSCYFEMTLYNITTLIRLFTVYCVRENFCELQSCDITTSVSELI